MSNDESSQFGDKGYFSDEKKRDLRKKGVYCGILDKGKRDHPLSTRQKQRNKQKSRVRCAVERPFAHMKKWYGYVRARYVNLKRNDLHFTFLCIIYNVRRGIVLIEPWAHNLREITPELHCILKYFTLFIIKKTEFELMIHL